MHKISRPLVTRKPNKISAEYFLLYQSQFQITVSLNMADLLLSQPVLTASEGGNPKPNSESPTGMSCTCNKDMQRDDIDGIDDWIFSSTKKI